MKGGTQRREEGSQISPPLFLSSVTIPVISIVSKEKKIYAYKICVILQCSPSRDSPGIQWVLLLSNCPRGGSTVEQSEPSSGSCDVPPYDLNGKHRMVRVSVADPTQLSLPELQRLSL